MDDPTQELLDRIEALERRIDALEAAGPRCSFHEEEKRVVDTIVRLTTEGVIAAIDERMERRHEEHRHDHDPPRRGPPPPGESRNGRGRGPPDGRDRGPRHR